MNGAHVIKLIPEEDYKDAMDYLGD